MNLNKNTTDISLRKVALIAGFGYLVIFIFGTFFGVVESFIVPGDAAATANNIMASESLFRLSIVGLIIVLVADAIVAWALYVFLRPIDKKLSLLTAWFRTLYVAMFGILLLNLVNALQVLTSNPNHAQAMLYLTAYQNGFNIAYVLFGLHIFGLGYLILKSKNIPKILGILLIIASVGYQIDSFASILSSTYASINIMFIIFIAVPAIISELSLTLWLLIKGGKTKQMKS